MKITARFTQGNLEVKRYALDYTLDLAVGETVLSIATPIIAAAQNQSDAQAPMLVINNVV